MTRTPVDSSNIREIGHDATGLEVQFHDTDCLRRRSRGGMGGYGHPGVCSCQGGDVFHYPGVPAELHQQLMASQSVGSHFMKNVRGAAHPQTGELLYPGVKREEAKRDA